MLRLYAVGMENVIYTVGHSNQDVASFVERLNQHGITAIADVRSAPYSQFCPQFNREPLAMALSEVGIAYVDLGREFGARRIEPECYVDGRVHFLIAASTSGFRQGILRVLRGLQDYRIALMCAEKEPLGCHRMALVGRALSGGFQQIGPPDSEPLVSESGPLPIEVRHILDDGTCETHAATESRLLQEYGFPERDLFRTRSELLADAYERHEEKTSYRTS